jgi:hypothetical protein
LLKNVLSKILKIFFAPDLSLLPAVEEGEGESGRRKET